VSELVRQVTPKICPMAISLKRKPAVVCDNPDCGRYLWWLHAVGAVCFHCHRGRFVHRGEWRFEECACGRDPCCKRCYGSGVLAQK
jgi:hypothetical protein